ncbi:MAG: hypothetical protein P8Y63_06890 [Deltaproteobacteria bacterium]
MKKFRSVNIQAVDIFSGDENNPPIFPSKTGDHSAIAGESQGEKKAVCLTSR